MELRKERGGRGSEIVHIEISRQYLGRRLEAHLAALTQLAFVVRTPRVYLASLRQSEGKVPSFNTYL